MAAEPQALLKRIAADTAALLDCIEHEPGSELASLVAGMQQQANTWSYAQGRLDRRVEQTGVYADDGYRAAAPWIAFHSNLRRGVVKVRGRHALHLEAMPAADALLGPGCCTKTTCVS